MHDILIRWPVINFQRRSILVSSILSVTYPVDSMVHLVTYVSFNSDGHCNYYDHGFVRELLWLGNQH